MIKRFLLIFLLLLYYEFLFGFLTFNSYLRSSIINIFLFTLITSVVLVIITGLFKDKVNKIVLFVCTFLLGLLYSLQFVFKNIVGVFFCLSYFSLTDQALHFKESAVISILRNFYGIIIFFLPFILLILLRKKYLLKRIKLGGIAIYFGALVFLIGGFILNIRLQKGEDYSIYQLYNKINDNSLNIEKLGVMNASVLDVYRSVFGFREEVILNDGGMDKILQDEIFDYDYNVLDLDMKESSSDVINSINSYVNSVSGTKKNKYTGIFKDYNLVYITAESFSEIGVSKELTPTLYKLVNDGFVFNNFYTSNNLSTLGGEFQSLTGLYAMSSILYTWRMGNNYFPMGLGNVFKDSGYSTFAYHDYYYAFQDRNKYLNAMGFDNYKGCYSGLEKIMDCSHWPNSDVEMISATYKDYVSSDKPFLAYYMTVSGHYGYDFSSNYISLKNKDMVKDLPYSVELKAYIATQIELDRALELLIEKLEDSGVLDKTVIVLLADHYPYALNMSDINSISTYDRDSMVEVNSNNLIIWNNMVKHTSVDKACMSIDVIPTVYNLFGIDYDSRLFMGTDIFSNSEGLAFFKNRSWVSDNGSYFTSNGRVISNNDMMNSAYIDKMNGVVQNRMNLSQMILESDYYRYLFK